jgi:prepilin-type N-terminal cleavage/methylation domain-containing protein
MNKRSGIDGCETNAGKTGRAFTLLELMVVIAIIMILATLALPAIGRIREKAKIEQTRIVCSQVALACRDYMLQYGKWPDMTEAPLGCGTGLNPDYYREVDDSFIHLLRGGDNGNNPPCDTQGNPKKTVFMEISPKLIVGGKLVDRWNNPIRVKFDADFNNFLTIKDQGQLNTAVAVWSAGPDNRYDKWADNITSW